MTSCENPQYLVSALLHCYSCLLLADQIFHRYNVYSCFDKVCPTPEGGGVVLAYKRLMGLCRWMGSHFHDWIGYHGVTFSIELLEWGRTFSDFWGKAVLNIQLANVPECLYCS